MGLSSNWTIRSCGIYLSGLSWKIWIYHSVKSLKFICWDNFTTSPEIIHLFSSDNSFVCVMVVSRYLLSPSLIPLTSVYSTRYPPHGLLWPHHRGQCPKNLKRQTCCMRSQSHERLWPALLKLKFGNSWLTSNCCGNSCKKFNSSFQFQFQFQGFQFPIPLSIPPMSIPIPILELELELSCNSNSGIELTPTLLLSWSLELFNWLWPSYSNGDRDLSQHWLR